MNHSGNLYADLSHYYDLFCAEVNYAEQCEFAQRVFSIFACSGGRDYLDLACGTGPHIHHMQSHGFTATGLDNSPAMLEQAARRCPSASLLLCDLAAFEYTEAFDLITCFLYSIHYSHPMSALQETLARAWHALKPGGVLLFNTVDIKGINSRHFVSTQQRQGNRLLTFTSGWTYAGQGDAMDLHLTITEETVAEASPQAAMSTRSWHDRHTMTAVDSRDLLAWLSQLGFEVTLFEHDYSRLQSWSGDSFNILVVAAKPLIATPL